MLAMILQRLVSGALTLFFVISLTFFLLHQLPGGPFDQERQLPPAIKANIEAQYHLDKPLLEQYGLYMSGIARGDFGPSYKYQSRRVSDIIAESLWFSVVIGFWALLLGVVAGMLCGTWAGVTLSALVDGLLLLMGVSSLSMPSFIFGGLLILMFSLHLGLLPAARLETPLHYILPVLTLAIVPFAYALLLTRSSVKETKTLSFVNIKRSYGLSDSTITRRHILRNSLLPLLSIIGPLAAAIITGSFAVEFIFAIPGLGKAFIQAVANRDYTLVMGITIVFSVILISFNTLTDLLYGILDPRLSESEKGGNV